MGNWVRSGGWRGLWGRGGGRVYDGEFGDGDGCLDEGSEDPGVDGGKLELEPVAGLVAAEEGGGFVLVEAGDDGEVGAGAGAQVGAFDEDGDCGPGYFGGGVGWGRGGGQAGNDGGDGVLRFAGFGDEGGDGGRADRLLDDLEQAGIAEDAHLGGGHPAGDAVGEVGGEPGAIG